VNHTRTGVMLGLALAFAAILGGWTGLLLALVLGGLGGVIGAHLDGRIDLRALSRAVRGQD
jgi:hypothetical protein